MKILVLGAGSQLVEPLRSATERFNGHGHDLVVSETDVREFTRVPGDVDAVVNLAAVSSVDACEADPMWAYGVNAGGALKVADACARTGAYCLFFSTDYVFGGCEGDDEILPDAKRAPLNVYGHSKMLGEDATLALGGSVARVSWLIGARFLTILRDRARSGTVEMDLSAISRPAFVSDVAAAVVGLCERRAPGVHHLVNPPTVTRADLVEALLEALWLDAPLVATGAGAVPRPTFTPLANTGGLPDWRKALPRVTRGDED